MVLYVLFTVVVNAVRAVTHTVCAFLYIYIYKSLRLVIKKNNIFLRIQ
jgi:hypothetical protein